MDPNKPALLQRPGLREKWNKFSGDATKQYKKAADTASGWADDASKWSRNAWNSAEEYVADGIKRSEMDPRVRQAQQEAMRSTRGPTLGERTASHVRGSLGNTPHEIRSLGGNASLGTKARVAGKLAGKAVPYMSAVDAVSSSMEDDSTSRYARRFGVAEPTGDGSVGDIAKFVALRAGGFASDLGDAMTFGLAGDNLYRDKLQDAEAAAKAAAAAKPAAKPTAATQPAAAAKPAAKPTAENGRVATFKDQTGQINAALQNAGKMVGSAPNVVGIPEMGSAQYRRGLGREVSSDAALAQADAVTQGLGVSNAPQADYSIKDLKTSGEIARDVGAMFQAGGPSEYASQLQGLNWRGDMNRLGAEAAMRQYNSGFGMKGAMRAYNEAMSTATTDANNLMDADTSIRNTETETRAGLAKAALAAEQQRYATDTDRIKSMFNDEVQADSARYSTDMGFRANIANALLDDAATRRGQDITEATSRYNTDVGAVTSKYSTDTQRATSKYNDDLDYNEGLLGKVLDYDKEIRGGSTKGGLTQKDIIELSRADQKTKSDAINNDGKFVENLGKEFGDEKRAQKFAESARVYLDEEAKSLQEMYNAGKVSDEQMQQFFIPEIYQDGTTGWRQRQLSEMDNNYVQNLVKAERLRSLWQESKGGNLEAMGLGAVGAAGAGAYRQIKAGGAKELLNWKKAARNAAAGAIAGLAARQAGMGSDAEGMNTDDLRMFTGWKLDANGDYVSPDGTRKLDKETFESGVSRGVLGAINPFRAPADGAWTRLGNN